MEKREIIQWITIALRDRAWLQRGLLAPSWKDSNNCYCDYILSVIPHFHSLWSIHSGLYIVAQAVIFQKTGMSRETGNTICCEFLIIWLWLTDPVK